MHYLILDWLVKKGINLFTSLWDLVFRKKSLHGELYSLPMRILAYSLLCRALTVFFLTLRQKVGCQKIAQSCVLLCKDGPTEIGGGIEDFGGHKLKNLRTKG